MIGFVTEETMKYRVIELRAEAERSRDRRLREDRSSERAMPKSVQFRGRWGTVEDVSKGASRF